MNEPAITLRIIGGTWRSRKISFPHRDDLRPTPDRVRETLFNWLQFEVADTRCLELYAGSGVLSMEALSRGAAHATIIDADAVSVAAIDRNLQKLGCSPARYTLKCQQAESFIDQVHAEPFDIVFLDPPFRMTSPEAVLAGLLQHSMVRSGSNCYVESGQQLDAANVPPGFSIVRQKQAGQVHYGLLNVELN